MSLRYLTSLSDMPRSEEHTSELQSRPHLVCRLLLEKKNKKKKKKNKYLYINRDTWLDSKNITNTEKNGQK